MCLVAGVLLAANLFQKDSLIEIIPTDMDISTD